MVNLGQLIGTNYTLDKKSIPSKVFFNHFYAIDRHISTGIASLNFKTIDYFNNLITRNLKFDLAKVKKLLHNAWSTEFAISLSAEIDNDDFYKNSMHWNFPQAYYSVYLAMTAFHETQGVANDQHEKSIKIFGNSAKDDHYPKAISFYSKGEHEDFKFCNLPDAEGFKGSFTGLSAITTIAEEQTQIAKFLNSTRVKNAEAKRERLKEQKDKKFFSKKGEFKKNFKKGDWDLIYRTIPETSVMNLLYRLRIKANYHDVDAFIHANIDFKTFHKALSSIVYHLNFVHEAYIYKCIGKTEYENIVNSFPVHLCTDLALKRLRKISAF